MQDGNDYREWILLLNRGDEQAFEFIYTHFVDRLYSYVFRKVQRKEQSEEIVQEIFISLWNNRETLQIKNSLESYLFGAARYKIISFIRSEQVRKKYATDFIRFASDWYDNSVEERTNVMDLQLVIDTRVSQLPEKCRTAFRMSRMEHESISRIAEKMRISTGTVENYLSRALRHLRTGLDELLIFVFLLFIE